MPSIILLSRGITLKVFLVMTSGLYCALQFSVKCLILRYFYRSYVDLFLGFSRISGNLSFILYST